MGSSRRRELWCGTTIAASPPLRSRNNSIDEGRLGKIFHYRAKFLQDWTISSDLPQGGEGLWRLDAAVAGSGVTGDLLAHVIDTAMWLNGGIAEVSGVTETFIKSRPHALTGKVEPVSIDDASLFLARFHRQRVARHVRSNALRARGHKALYTLEINGEHASITWDLHDLHRLQYFDHRDQGLTRGWRNLHITDRDHPYMSHWWVPGLQIGFEHSFIHWPRISASPPQEKARALHPRSATRCSPTTRSQRRSSPRPQIAPGWKFASVK